MLYNLGGSKLAGRTMTLWTLEMPKPMLSSLRRTPTGTLMMTEITSGLNGIRRHY
jgi:hypothetical protein